MARLEVNRLVGSIRGQIDGLVIYESGGQLLVRGSPRGRPSSTTAQTRVRAQHAVVAKADATLAPAQWQAWETFAKAVAALPGEPPAPRTGYLAFQSVNRARLLAGHLVEGNPPPPVWLPAPDLLQAAEITNDGMLVLGIRHNLAPDTGWWRVRATRTLPSPARQAPLRGLRLVADDPADSFLPIGSTTAKLVLPVATSLGLRPGDMVGIEIVALSTGFVTGGSRFWRRVRLE